MFSWFFHKGAKKFINAFGIADHSWKDKQFLEMEKELLLL